MITKLTFPSQLTIFKRQHFSTYGEMMRRTTVFGPEEFCTSAAKRIAAKIVSLQKNLERPVNISIAPGQTAIPIMAELALIGSIEKSILLNAEPKASSYLDYFFKNPEEENLFFKDHKTVSDLMGKVDPKISSTLKEFYTKVLPYSVDWKTIRYLHMVELIEDPVFQYGEIMNRWFFSKFSPKNSISSSNIFKIDITKPFLYPEIIKQLGGIDLGIIGIGENYHIAFNEPGQYFDSDIALVNLDKETIKHLTPIIPNIGQKPQALTLTTHYIINHIANIILLASGKNKNQAIKTCLFDEHAGPTSKSIAEYPAFAIRFHPQTEILLDTDAADGLKESDKREIEEVQGDKKNAKILLEELDFRKKFSEFEIREMEKSLAQKYLGYTISAKDIKPILKEFIESELQFYEFEDFLENKIFDFYKENAFEILLNVDKKKKGEKQAIPYEKQKLAHVFRHILRVFRFPHISKKITERKKLLADMILKDVIAKAYLPTASEMRKNLAIEVIFKHAIQHQNESNHLIALETIFELIAKQLKEGGNSVFFSFLPLIKKADDTLRIAQLLLNLLIKAKNKKVILFLKDNLGNNLSLTNEEFFKMSYEIILMIAASSEKLSDIFIKYFKASIHNNPEEEGLLNSIISDIEKIKKIHVFAAGTNLDISDRTKIIFRMYKFFKEKDLLDLI